VPICDGIGVRLVFLLTSDRSTRRTEDLPGSENHVHTRLVDHD